MTGSEGRFARFATAYGRVIEVSALALLAYVPFFASSPHEVSADTKQFLYLGPARLLSRAPYLWDPHVAAGTVPHQQIGYLFPMGPYFWLMDRIGVPDWVAQRLWLGTISFVAVLGARWLFRQLGTGRAGAVAGALVYMLTPYQLAFTARISVLLLPWAVLPWLLGCTMRAAREGGWRYPAVIALLVLVAGSVNASALLLAGIAPVVWLIVEAARGREQVRRVLAATGRIALLSIGASAWWAVGLRTQGAYGLPVLQLTENVRTVAGASLPNDVLRGLGNWFFYGRDRIGYSLDQASYYASNRFVVTASYAVPVVALLGAFLVRWRYRAYFAVLVIAGTVVAVGAWPYDDSSPYGALWKRLANNWSPMLALRNTPRVVPIIVLGLAALLAAAVGALAPRRLRFGAAGLVAVLAAAAFAPVWRTGYLSDGTNRPENIPQYWHDAAAAMQREGDATRVLEVPGSSFATYRWGNAVEPVTPALIDRPYLAREVLPYGTPPSVDLVDAFDRRMQQATFEPQTLASVARLLGAGTVSLRSDLAYERSGSPRPRPLWAQLTQPLAPGMRAPATYGPATRNQPDPPLLDTTELATPRDVPDPPAVALFPVDHAVPIVHTAPTNEPVVLAGSGDGIVDASGAGLLDGDQLTLELAGLDDATLAAALDDHAALVLTDSNRRRYRNFFSSISDTASATERAGQTTTDPNGYEFRLDVFPGSTDDSRTVVEQLGGRVDATADGGAARPEDRPVYAFDGDLRTAWRVGGARPQGNHITVVPDQPVRTDHVTLVQPLDGARDRVLTKVRLRFDDGTTRDVALGPSSLTRHGQVVRFPARTVRRLDVQLLATTTPSFNPQYANAVGFAEIGLGDLRVAETVRLPVDLADRVGSDARGHGLDVVMTRLRNDPTVVARQDEELALDRTFELPDARTFLLSGTARVNPRAPDDVLDRVLGTTADGATFTASSHLTGDADARASRAFDDDVETAWSSALGSQEGQWLQVALAKPVRLDRLDLIVTADGRHSVPTQLRLEVDGKPVRTLHVPAVADGPKPGASKLVSMRFAPVTGRRVRLVVEQVRHPVVSGRVAGDLPVAIGAATFGGPIVPAPAPPSVLGAPSRCRSDLMTVDGQPFAVRVSGAVEDARAGLPLSACAPSVALHAGAHRVVTRPGLDTGIDVDRVVLSSDASGAPTAVAARGAPLATAGATVEESHTSPTSVTVRLRTDGTPFWLVLGQSHSDGWHASVSSGSIGPLQLVDGYANGWLVRPSRDGTITVHLRWTPQRFVWAGFGVSAIAIAACGVILVRGRRRNAVSLAAVPRWVPPASAPRGATPSWVVTAAAAAGVFVVTAAVSRPWVGLVGAAATVLAAQWPRTRLVIIAAVPLLLVCSRAFSRPFMAWVAVALFGVDVLVGALRARAAAPVVSASATERPSTATVPRP